MSSGTDGHWLTFISTDMEEAYEPGNEDVPFGVE